MHLEKITLQNFRSYREVTLDFPVGPIIFVGPNGIGKTNIVEAIGYLSSLESHRVSNDSPLIRFGEEQAIIRALFARDKKTMSIDLEINAHRGNRAQINRANPVRAKNIIGLFPIIFFSPEDLNLVKGDPGDRRRFLDNILQMFSSHYADIRLNYEKVLKQRNALLRTPGISRKSIENISKNFLDTLQVWDHHLALLAAQIFLARSKLVEYLKPFVETSYQEISDREQRFEISYKSSVEEFFLEAQLEDLLAERTFFSFSERHVNVLRDSFVRGFAQLRKRELERGITLLGTHRDNLELVLDGAPIKGFASHGETWSAALSLKLASYKFFCTQEEFAEFEPILILDDVFSELDTKRREKLAKISTRAEQVFITAAVVQDLPKNIEGKILFVEDLL